MHRALTWLLGRIAFLAAMIALAVAISRDDPIDLDAPSPDAPDRD